MSLKTITIEGNSIKPTLQGPGRPLSDQDAIDASGTDYILIQSDGPLSAGQKTELRDLEVNIQKYVSEQTYLRKYSPANLERLRAKDFVLYANVFLPDLKVNADLKNSGRAPASMSASTGPELQDVNITFHDGVDPSSEAIKNKVAEKAQIDVASLRTSSRKVSLNVDKQHLQELASIDEVRSIDGVRKRVLFNNLARTILNVDITMNDTTYQGHGQVVAVADTGFDKGNTIGDVHPAFTGRVAKLYPLAKPDAADPESVDKYGHHEGGHGTHVCGSVLGDGNSEILGCKIQGTAPQATLVMQACATVNGQLEFPDDLGDLFIEPYENDGARIHTNSWGVPYRGSQFKYDQSAEDIDAFVWDHKDMTILFAAGNDGRDQNGKGLIDPRQIGSEAVAKNCITVGASETKRPDYTAVYADFDSAHTKFPADPIRNDLIADNPEGMAAFSSRGPSVENSIKPDVTAPGTAILSARARSLSRKIGSASDSNWMFLSGTSMATPLVAGCIAVLRETLVKNKWANPPAALLKALLINGAVDMQGQYLMKDVGPSPNCINGWGRVNLAGSIILPPGAGGDTNSALGIGGPLKEREEGSFVIRVPTRNTGVKLKITLVWTDPPARFLQNNLNLIVKAANGEERHGNMDTQPGFDTTNNVEQISWENIPPGDAKVTVKCASITKADQLQDYAYAWRLL